MKFNLHKLKLLPVIAGCICLLSQVSCRKFIYEKPIRSTNDANFWVNSLSAEEAVAGAYLALRNAVENGNTYWVFGDLSGEEFTTSAWNFARFIPGSNKQYSYAPYIPVGDWGPYYKVINQCNLMIARVPQIPLSGFNGDAKLRDQYIGEALFLRAFAYFSMVKIWGAPVLYNQLLTDPSHAPQLPRSPDSTVLNSCIADLKSAITQLPVTPPNNAGPARASQMAAYALLAHIYAWQRDYVKASQACDAVLSPNVYQLESKDNYLNIWNGGDKESIFELNMLYSSGPSEASLTNSNGTGFYGVFLEPPFVSKDAQAGSLYRMNTDLLYSVYDTANDMRYKKCFATSDAGNVLLMKYHNVQYVSGSDPTQGFYVNNNLVIFRLADIMLLQAEAQAYLGNAGQAQALVKQIRDRAGVRPYNANLDGDLYHFIINERTRELYGEGARYYDLIRSNLLSTTIPALTAERINQGGYLWPIDLNTLKQTDPLLTQTPWWESH